MRGMRNCGLSLSTILYHVSCLPNVEQTRRVFFVSWEVQVALSVVQPPILSHKSKWRIQRFTPILLRIKANGASNAQRYIPLVSHQNQWRNLANYTAVSVASKSSGASSYLNRAWRIKTSGDLYRYCRIKIKWRIQRSKQCLSHKNPVAHLLVLTHIGRISSSKKRNHVKQGT